MSSPRLARALALMLLAAPGIAAAQAPARPAPAQAGAPAGAQGVQPVPRETGADPAAMAKRLRMLEDRVDNMWSVRQGPDVLALDTVDRMATRLLAVEARLAALEKGGGGGTRELAIATSLSLIAATDIERIATMSAGVGTDDVLRLRHLVALTRLTPWPPELAARARAMADALHLTLKALSRGDRKQVQRLARGAGVARLQLVTAGLGWTTRAMTPDPAHAHMDHSSRHGGQLAMRGDLHLEVVLRAGADAWTYEVYLSDATRTPLWTDAVTGDIVLDPDGDSPVTVALASQGDRLTGRGPARPGPQPVDLRVRLDGTTQGRVEMDFRVPLLP